MVEPEKQFFRVVIGCYSDGPGHWSAMNELLANGFEDRQMCSLGSSAALSVRGSKSSPSLSPDLSRLQGTGYERKQVRDLALQVSASPLFERLWPTPYLEDDSLTCWMTADQSGVIWRKLREDCPVLMISANSAQQQLKCVQIQFRHGPTVVQAFNFAMC